MTYADNVPTVTRVRALLITPDGRALVIRRVKPGIPPYWMLVGGGIEPADESLDAAVGREITEETGGHAVLHRLIHVADIPGHGCHAVYLARIDHWSEQERTGPEFVDPANGEYHLDLLPLEAATFADRVLRPAPTAAFLAAVLARGGDVFGLPDVRDSVELAWAPRVSMMEGAA